MKNELALISFDPRPIIENIGVRHPLYCWSHELHLGVNDLVWIYVGQLDSLLDLMLQALGPSPGNRELNGQGVPG